MNKSEKNIKIVYAEPEDYFPEEIRRKYKLGEFAEKKDVSAQANKIKSVMIGHAVGDAFGVPVEFEDRETLRGNPVTDMRGFGTYPVPAGAWSDDTGMSIAALDAMCREGWKWQDVMDNFVAWLEKGEYTPTGESFDVGRTCLEAIVSYCRGEADAKSCGRKGEYSNGNGSLMRIHPFVLWATLTFLNHSEEGYWLWMACIKQASELTHAHERSVMGCYIYGYCLSFLLKEPTRESLMAGIKFAGEDLDYLAEFEHYKRIFDPDFENLTADDIKSTGYVVDTLEAALWCVLTTDSYKDCILKAVNLGGDTDTIAAIAGGLAGALYGYGNIPEEWRKTLIKREYIEKMCDEAADTWSNVNVDR